MAEWKIINFLLIMAFASLTSGKEYFYIKSQLHNMVAEVMYKDQMCGALIGTNWQVASSNDHQLWYAENNKLRSKLNEFCLEKRKDGYMVVSPCLDGDDTQLWSVNGDRIQHGTDANTVIEVTDEDHDLRARIRASPFAGSAGQAWSTPDTSAPIDPRPTGNTPQTAPAADIQQFFFIKSKANFLVASVKDRLPLPGAQVVMWSQFSVDNAYQLWYQDPSTGIIKNKMNGYCLTTTPLGLVVMAPCSGCARNQNWIRVGEFCQNGEKQDLVLDISGFNLQKGARMSSWTYHGGDNQRWTFEACTPQRCR